MAQTSFSLVTNIGRLKLALAAAGGPSLTLSHFAIGDGNGAEVMPTSSSVALVREVWRTGLESVEPDPLNPTAVIASAILPTNVGGFYMREFGLFDHDGDLVAVAKPVTQYKPTALEGQLEDIRYEFQLVVGEAANVTLLVDPSLTVATREWVASRRINMAQLWTTPFVPVKSVTLAIPPAAPAVGDLYVVPAAATGAWNGHGQKIAEWNGTAWAIWVTPNGHLVSLPDATLWQKKAGVYGLLPIGDFATEAETIAGLLVDKPTHPKGVAAAIKAALATGRTVSTNVTAVVNEMLFVDTDGAAREVMLPANPRDQARLFIGRIGANLLKILRNGQTIEGLAEDLTIDVDRVGVWLVFTGGTWRLIGEVLADAVY